MLHTRISLLLSLQTRLASLELFNTLISAIFQIPLFLPLPYKKLFSNGYKPLNPDSLRRTISPPYTMKLLPIKLRTACILVSLSSVVNSAAIIASSKVSTSIHSTDLDGPLETRILRDDEPYVDRCPSLHARKWHNSNFGITCADDHERIRECQISDYQYFCTSNGQLTKNSHIGNTWCDSHCFCNGLIPNAPSTLATTGTTNSDGDPVDKPHWTKESMRLALEKRSISEKMTCQRLEGDDSNEDREPSAPNLNVRDNTPDFSGCFGDLKTTLQINFHSGVHLYKVFIYKTGELYSLASPNPRLKCAVYTPGAKDKYQCTDCHALIDAIEITQYGGCFITLTNEKGEEIFLEKSYKDGLTDLKEVGYPKSVTCYGSTSTSMRNLAINQNEASNQSNTATVLILGAQKDKKPSPSQSANLQNRDEENTSSLKAVIATSISNKHETAKELKQLAAPANTAGCSSSGNSYHLDIFSSNTKSIMYVPPDGKTYNVGKPAGQLQCDQGVDRGCSQCSVRVEKVALTNAPTSGHCSILMTESLQGGQVWSVDVSLAGGNQPKQPGYLALVTCANGTALVLRD